MTSAFPAYFIMKRFECCAVLFDLDGVLVDSKALVEAQWRHWAEGKGLPAGPFLQVCHGRRAVETIRLAAPQLDAEAEVAAFVPNGANDDHAIRPIEGAPHLLQSLPLGSWAVATSGGRAAATERLVNAGLPVPRVLICAEDVLHGKPSPDVYLIAAARLAVSPSDCLVVEDAPAGVEAARAAGMGVVALTTTHTKQELPADAWAASLTQVCLGRIDRQAWRSDVLELLVVDR